MLRKIVNDGVDLWRACDSSARHHILNSNAPLCRRTARAGNDADGMTAVAGPLDRSTALTRWKFGLQERRADGDERCHAGDNQ